MEAYLHLNLIHMARATSPIYGLPIELLCEIFIFVSETDQFGPVKITGVCHPWRDIILATPSAWSWICMRAIEKEENIVRYSSLFIERSQQCVLHIHIPVQDVPDKGRGRLLSILSFLIQYSHRIQCLSIPSCHFGFLRDVTFPSLLCLRFNEQDNGLVGVFEFSNKAQYPRLQVLHTFYCCWIQSATTPKRLALSSLRHLSIQASGDATWVKVITACAKTLITLNVKGPLLKCGISGLDIKLPRLQRLMIDNSSTDDDTFWPFEAATPSLISYEELTGIKAAPKPIHHDITTVTHLRTDNMQLIRAFPALCIIQHTSVRMGYKGKHDRKFIEEVKESARHCPTLECFMFYLGSGAKSRDPLSVQRSLTRRIARAGRAIEFKFVGWGNFPDLPGETLVCGRNLRCRYDQWVNTVCESMDLSFLFESNGM